MTLVCQAQQPCHILSELQAVSVFSSIEKHDSIASETTTTFGSRNYYFLEIKPTARKERISRIIYTPEIRHLNKDGVLRCLETSTQRIITSITINLVFAQASAPLSREFPTANFVSSQTYPIRPPTGPFTY
jgi:hypothetical protein